LINFLICFNVCQRSAIRNVGHFETPTYQVAKPFIKCYVVKF
jgi:hypothetical protein